MTDYWMQERPDHLVEFHVTLSLKISAPVVKFMTLRVADPEYFIDFEFDDKLVSPPSAVLLLARQRSVRQHESQISPIENLGAGPSGLRWRAGSFQ